MGRILQQKPIEVVLLDYDGVIADSLITIHSFYEYVCKKHGKKFDMNFDEFREWFPYDWRNGYGSLGFSDKEISTLVIPEFMKFMNSEIIPVYNGVETVLRKIHNNCNGPKLGIVSTNHTGQIKNNLRSHGLLRFFDTVVGYEDVSEIKPSPEGMLTALSSLGVKDCNVLIVGDSTEDYAAATRAKEVYNGGILFLFAAYGHYTRQKFVNGVIKNGLEVPPVQITSINGVLPWVI